MIIGKLKELPILRKRPKLAYTVNQMQREQSEMRPLPGFGVRMTSTPLGTTIQVKQTAEAESGDEPVWGA